MDLQVFYSFHIEHEAKLLQVSFVTANNSMQLELDGMDHGPGIEFMDENGEVIRYNGANAVEFAQMVLMASRNVGNGKMVATFTMGNTTLVARDDGLDIMVDEKAMTIPKDWLGMFLGALMRVSRDFGGMSAMEASLVPLLKEQLVKLTEKVAKLEAEAQVAPPEFPPISDKEAEEVATEFLDTYPTSDSVN